MIFSKLFSVSLLLLFALQFASATVIPPTYKLFSGTIDFTGVTNADFSSLCGTEGISCDCTGLITYIDLPSAGYDMVSFTDLKYMPGLKSLVINNNNIIGLFPTEICLLEHLQELNLSRNDFLGELPKCLCNLAYLKYLNVNDNRFQGTLPTCVAGLASLEGAQLRCNLFDLPLPLQVNDMQNIEDLDYTCNNYKSKQPEIQVPLYSYGDVCCRLCTTHSDVCPAQLYQYGSGTFEKILCGEGCQ